MCCPNPANVSFFLGMTQRLIASGQAKDYQQKQNGRSQHEEGWRTNCKSHGTAWNGDIAHCGVVFSCRGEQAGLALLSNFDADGVFIIIQGIPGETKR